MPRVARLDSPGVLQHVIVRGNEGKKIFLDDQDRRQFLDRLPQLLKDPETLCYGWALIPNHFHLLLLPCRFKLAALMRRLLTGYADDEGDVGSNATWRRMKKEGYFPSLPGVPVSPYQFHPSPHLCLLDLVVQCTSQTRRITVFKG
jgi:REP element-mobilizing transposase RayT